MSKKLTVLLLLTFLGGFLRFFLLNKFPVSLNWDEVSHGYNAYSILLTGKDEWGKSFPLIFRAFGDYKLPLYIYLTVIPVWFLGLSEFSVRAVSALAGTLAIPGIYLLVKELFPNRKLLIGKAAIPFEFIASFLMVFIPWHFFISRPALEANLALTLTIFGFYFLLRFFNKSSSLVPSVILLGLSLHTYNTARVFVPTLVLVSFIIFHPALGRVFKKNIFAIFFAILFSGLFIFQVIVGEGTARYEKLKILSPSAVFQIGESRSQSKLPPVISKIIHNRPVYFATTVAKNYLGYFSPDFFSQRWGAQYQFAIPQKNLLTLPIFLLALVGFFSFLPSLRAKRGNPENINHFRFLYAWLLLSPLAAALTADPPQALRPNPMIPVLVIFACFGLVRITSLVSENKKILVVAFFTVWYLGSIVLYLSDYFVDYSQKYSLSWQYGYKQVISYVNKHQSEYDKVFITKRWGEPHIFYAFYSSLSPNLLQPGSDNIRFEKSDWYWTDKIRNVYFVNDWQIPTIGVESLLLESGEEISTRRSLLITSPDHVPVNAHVIETVSFLDGKPAYIITSVP